MNEVALAIFGSWLALGIATAPTVNQPPGRALIALHVYPSQVALTTSRDQQTVVVQAEYADGITRDVTDKAEWKANRDDVATREGNKFVPKADGDAIFTVAFELSKVDVPVSVKQAKIDPPISFKLDVMPVF